MLKKEINMPATVRYMTEAGDWLLKQLPSAGKFILDKSLTGCGGTELFLGASFPLVMIAPRVGVLINKAQQHPECHLFRDSARTDISVLKNNLRDYLDRHLQNPLVHSAIPPRILVTPDSARYVIEELVFRKLIDSFHFLVDEFQCLMSDAVFKGNTELEFIRMIDSAASNICYMSATPIDDLYLGALPEFKNLSYFTLTWDPHVIVEPTVRECMMRKGESTCSIVRSIINDFRSHGYFARKSIDGTEVYATEAVFFVNEVKTILRIIRENNLQPEEVTVLISASNKYVSEFKRLGFEIEGQCTDRENPSNKTFTLCSKASFEGRDFYSLCAFTYIFLDGSKDWQTHDTTIEIPQMLGRQRLDANPFRYNAVIFYRTKPAIESGDDFMLRLKGKLDSSHCIVDAFNSGNAALRKSLANLVRSKDPNNFYNDNYLDVICDVSGNYSLEINLLVAAAEHNLWANKSYFYSSPLLLTSGIRKGIAPANIKPAELRDFENRFNEAGLFNEKLRLYCSFRDSFPIYLDALMANPFIEPIYHQYYVSLGSESLAALDFDEKSVVEHYRNCLVLQQCQVVFQRGKSYTSAQIKESLQKIYDRLGIRWTAKASQITALMKVEKIQITASDGSRPRVYRIIE